jgi:branched-chain amino acid transport system ATP-binding protein
MSNPRLLLCDEISLGLAPVAVRELYKALPGVVDEGVSLLVIEQDIGQAMAAADRVYCLQEGRVTLAGAPGELTRERVAAAYFGS